MQPRAIAFDLFHTLVDPEDFRPRSFHRARVIAGILGVPETSFEAFWTADRPDRLVRRHPTAVDRIRQYAELHGVRPPESSWVEIEDILGRYQDAALLAPRPTVLRALQQLRAQGYRVAVVSNCDERERRTWSQSPLSEVIDVTVFSCDVGHAKPSIEAYRAVASRWGGIPLAEAAFVGDGNDDELMGARQAGFGHVIFQRQFVGTNGLRSTLENDRLRSMADRTIDDLQELVEFVAVSE